MGLHDIRSAYHFLHMCARSNHTTHSPMMGSSSLGPQGYGSMADSSSLKKRGSMDAGAADGGGMRNGSGLGSLSHIRSLSVPEPKNTRSSDYYQEELGHSNGVFGSINGGNDPSAAAESREDESLLYHEGGGGGGGGALGGSRTMRMFK